MRAAVVCVAHALEARLHLAVLVEELAVKNELGYLVLGELAKVGCGPIATTNFGTSHRHKLQRVGQVQFAALGTDFGAAPGASMQSCMQAIFLD